MELIKTEALCKSYLKGNKKVEVLRVVDLSIKQGEITAILGASGVGKSTLLHIMGLLDSPTSGKVFYDGRDVFSQTEKERAVFRNQTIGFVFQFHHLLPEFTALENVEMPMLLGGVNRDTSREKAERLLKETGLANRLNHKPGELSGGEQQRVAIARALVQSPKLLLADEPTGNLDVRTGEEIFSLLWRMNVEKGTTMVIVTHNERLVEKITRQFRMVDGSLFEKGEE